MLQSANLGYPRIGARRELKHALERYWKGGASQAELLETARIIRQENWQLQRNLGLDIIPSNDFSLYDQVLDTAAMLGAIPRRFGWSGGLVDPDTYFGMARRCSKGRAGCSGHGNDEVVRHQLPLHRS